MFEGAYYVVKPVRQCTCLSKCKQAAQNKNKNKDMTTKRQLYISTRARSTVFNVRGRVTSTLFGKIIVSLKVMKREYFATSASKQKRNRA